VRRCQHSWIEARRAFTPSRLTGEFEAEQLKPEDFERLIFGVTTVELRCVNCGDVKGVTLLGQVESER